MKEIIYAILLIVIASTLVLIDCGPNLNKVITEQVKEITKHVEEIAESKKALEKPKTETVVTIDCETLKVYVVEKELDECYPLENPNTKKKTLYLAWCCPETKRLFIYPQVEDVRFCPFCGGQVDKAKPEEKEYPVAMPE